MTSPPLAPDAPSARGDDMRCIDEPGEIAIKIRNGSANLQSTALAATP